MKIVVAPNAFKGSLTTHEAAAAISKGILRAFPRAEITMVPVADGGDGLIEVAVDVFQAENREKEVTGPDFVPVKARYCLVPDRKLAAIEMALASGLALLPPDRLDPTATTTYGTGELIKEALDADVEQILVGIGGSATNDGGIGAAAALGIAFLDTNGKEVPPTGAGLHLIEHIDMSARDPRLDAVTMRVACDVDNPLTGPRGAAGVYGPQKGAGPDQVAFLEEGLEHLARCIRRDVGIDVLSLSGGGAAGGLGAGLHAFLGGKLQKGVDLILEMVGLEEKIRGADLVVTGEGQIDFQTIYGKAPAGVAAMARSRNIPCVALAGSVGENLGELHAHGLDAVFSICPGPLSLKNAMANSSHYVAAAAEQVVRCFFADLKKP